MLKKQMIFFFLCIAAYLNGMDADKEEQLRKYQELKVEREARKQSGQELQPKQDNSERSLPAYTLPPYSEEEYQKRLIELETKFEKAREIGKQHAMATQKMTKEELRAKLKCE